MPHHEDDFIQKPVGSFLEAVLVRPLMYTINGTLEEVGAFLEGFYSGMAAHNKNKSAQEEAQFWFDFCEWASTKISDSEVNNWHSLFKGLRQQVGDESDAFRNLLIFYKEFRETYNK